MERDSMEKAVREKVEKRRGRAHLKILVLVVEME